MEGEFGKTAKALSVAMIFLSVAFIGLASPTAAAPPEPVSVTVTNTSSNPVPVTLQGTSSVSGNVAVTNTPSVKVVNTPTVQVAGTVPTSAGIPSGQFSYQNSFPDTNVISGLDPEGTSYAVTSITVANSTSEFHSASIGADWGTPGGGTPGCPFLGGTTVETFGPYITVPAYATVHLSFPQPFVFAARPGAASCLRAELSDAGLSMAVVGFRF